jgi:hypothetical protein
MMVKEHVRMVFGLALKCGPGGSKTVRKPPGRKYVAQRFRPSFT